MKGHHGDKTIQCRRGWVSDGKLERAACFQTKNKRRWRLTQIKFLITSEVAIRGSSRQREQRQEHSVVLHSVVLHSGVEKWLMCWALFDVYVGQQTHGTRKMWRDKKKKNSRDDCFSFCFSLHTFHLSQNSDSPHYLYAFAKISNHYIWRTH